MENVAQRRMQRLRELDRRKIVVCWTFTAAIAAVMLAWGPEALYWKRPSMLASADLTNSPLAWLFPAAVAAFKVACLRCNKSSDHLLLTSTALATSLGLLAGPEAAGGAVWLYPHRIPPGDEYMRPALQFANWLFPFVRSWPRAGGGFGYFFIVFGLTDTQISFPLLWAILCTSTAALLAVWVWSRTRDEAI